MTNVKKTRMAMLDNLAGSPAPLAMKSSSRPLRAARDAVDAYRVWELDPDQIEDERVADRLNQEDVDDLRASIETSGQTVPILVRRHPSEEDRYLLVCGRRRVEAIRTSKEVDKVKALVANLDDEKAIEAQVSENTARRDLTYIEKALYAYGLLKANFGSQARVAEVFGVTKSWMSMAMTIVETITPDVIRAIGPAPGVGRPRWEKLANAIKEIGCRTKDLAELANHKHEVLREYAPANQKNGAFVDTSIEALKTVESFAERKLKGKKEAPGKPAPRSLSISGTTKGSIKRSGKKVQLEIEPGEFADWVEQEAQFLLEQMHIHWLEKNKN